MKPLPVALQMYSVREDAKVDLPGTLKRVADAGYVGVEMGVPKGSSPNDLKTMLDDLGLVKATGGARGIGGDDSEDSARDSAEKAVAEIVETARLFGYDTVLAGLGMKDSETLESTQAAAARLGRAERLLKPHGIKVVFHNHWMEFDHTFEGRTPHRIIMDSSPDVCAEVDTYWAAFAGADVPAVLREYGPRVPALHVKDGPLDEKMPHTAVGSGNMDWPAIMDAVDEGTKWLIVELDECATDMMEAVRDSVDFLVGAGYGRRRE